jgi:hypothetical protein
MRHQRVWHVSNFQSLDGNARRAHYILMGQVVNCWLDCVPYLSKDVKHFLAATQFPSKVHPNIFGIGHRSGALGDKPFGEPLDGRSLRAKLCY